MNENREEKSTNKRSDADIALTPFQIAESAGLVFGRTSDKAAAYIGKILGLNGSEIIADIGSGMGDFLFPMAELFPDAVLIGIEKTREYVSACEKRKTDSGRKYENLHFVNGDALDADYGIFDLLYMFCPLTDEADFYDRLSSKLATEMKPGAKLVCYGLDMGDPHIRKLFDERSGVVAGYDARRRCFLEKQKELFACQGFPVPEEISPWPTLVEVYTKSGIAAGQNRYEAARQWLQKYNHFAGAENV